MKKLKLNIKERVVLSDILPPQGTKLQQIVVRSLTLKTEFKPEEIDKFGLTFNQQGVSWNEKAKTKEFEIELQESEILILKESAILIDKESRVTQHNLSLLEKIDALANE